VLLRALAAATLATALLTACGGGHARRDGAILFTLGGRDASVEADGSGLRRIAPVGLVSPDGLSRLLPDGRLVTTSGARHVLGGGEARDFAWSPDGRRIAYSQLRGGAFALWTLDVASGHRSQLTHPPVGASDGAPRWSPDGRRLLFQRGGDVRVVGADGAGDRMLVASAHDAAWSPDGKRIAFVIVADYLVDDRLVVGNADAGDLHAVSEPGSFTSFAWRPDSRALAFTSLQGARFRLYLAEAPDFAPRPLLRDADSRPAWSPSGRMLAVAAGSPSAIWVVLPEQQERRRITGPGGSDPTWEPRGLAARSLGGAPLRHRYTPPPDGR
jgi:Tol biopolymer transport system component